MSVNSSGGSDREAGRSVASSVLAPSKFSSNFLSKGGNSPALTSSNTISSSSSNGSTAKAETGKSFCFKASKLAAVAPATFGTDKSKEKSEAATNEEKKDSEQAQKPVFAFIPLETKPILTETKNGSPEKKSPPKRSSDVEDDEEPVKRKKVDKPEPEVVSEKENKKQDSPAAPEPESSKKFVFGENLTERADNYYKDSSGFIFGQNLTERAENFSPEQKKEEPRAETPTGEAPAETTESKSPPKSLTESAAAYCESHSAQKRKFDEVVVVTGEEGEVNVVQMSGKLHWFDKGNWVERGRGLLRLNDIVEPGAKHSSPPLSSRIVMRTSGSLRVILNTKLYKDMPVDCPSEKNIRLTGMDEAGVMRVFLVTGAVKDISIMYAALQSRLAAIDHAVADGANSENDDSDQEATIKAPRLS